MGLFLLIGDKYDLLGFVNAISITTVALLASVWLYYAAAKGAFDMIAYGLSSFFLILRGKKKEKSYAEYTLDKKKINWSFVIGSSITLVIFLIASIILFIIFYNNK